MRRLLPWALLLAAFPAYAADIVVQATSTSEAGSATSCNPGEPSGAQDGDFILTVAMTQSTGGSWSDVDLTEIDNQNETNMLGAEINFYAGKVARGSSAANLTMSYSGTADNVRCAALLFRDADGDIDDLDVTYASGSHYNHAQNDGCDGDSSNITTNTDGAMVVSVAFCSNGSNTMTPPSGYTEQTDDTGSNSSIATATSRRAWACGRRCEGSCARAGPPYS